MNTNIDTITIPVRLDAATFRGFAIFDTLKRQKRWKSPAIFAAILMASAIVCFAMNSRADQAVLLGSVLTAIALGLPAVYFGMFFYSLDNQAKAMKLNAARLVYTVELSGRDDGIHVTSASGEGQTAQFHWKDSFAAYRAADCIYLYVSPRQAFLLPDEQADVTADELWDYLNAHMAAEKMHDCRKR
ncbi:MAG: YcxB family protein [Hungatella hathewayi]|nr:YcxB family protein [Hungatella hathewayi]